MEIAEIKFENLVLRPFVESDAAEFAEAVRESVSTVGRWMSWSSSGYSPAQALQWFAICQQAQVEGTALEFGVFCQNSGRFLGGAGLNEINQKNKFCNLGYWVRQSAQRHGVASRCVQALASYAFEQIGLYRVEIVVAVGNIASEGVALKSGARRESVARNRLVINDVPVAAHVFSLVP